MMNVPLFKGLFALFSMLTFYPAFFWWQVFFPFFFAFSVCARTAALVGLVCLFLATLLLLSSFRQLIFFWFSCAMSLSRSRL